MNDTRLTPANDRVAAKYLRHKVEAPTYVEATCMQIAVPVADLLRSPDGPRDRQILLGETVLVYEVHQGWAFVEIGKNGYVGYLRDTDIAEPVEMTHRVIARTTHTYGAPDFKAPEHMSLSYGSRLKVIADHGRFLETSIGFVPQAHLEHLNTAHHDLIAVAEIFLGTPYLWGGDSGFGLDCSGLVQAVCTTFQLQCPGDSDMQEAELGHDIPEDAPLQRGDLLFWKGHVAWVVDADTLIHANVHHMAVAYEPLHDAIKRIADQGDGPVTARKRLGETT